MKTSKMTMLGMLVAIILCSQSAMAFYNPQTGRWLSRDPIEEIAWQGAIEKFVRFDIVPKVMVGENTRNLYHFLFNDVPNATDSFGLEPAEGDICCGPPCRVTATFVRLSVVPELVDVGKKRKIAKDWLITVAIQFVMEGTCYLSGCKYWTCNAGVDRESPRGYTSGSCDAWPYHVGGPDPKRPNIHMKSMEGRIEYLSCEKGRYVKKDQSAGTLQNGFTYDPPIANAGDKSYP